MLTFRIGGVPEHFNLPWRLAIEGGVFEKAGLQLQWIDHAGGTGSMMQALREGKLDLAVCLTEGSIADIAANNKAKIVKIYVKSPLVWGIYVSAQRAWSSINELDGQAIGVSRWGSGSHLMAFIKARELGWNTKKLQFVALRDLEGIRKGIAQNLVQWFMWEKVMTQPYVANGELKLIDTCVTPWPCFVVVVSKQTLERYYSKIYDIMQLINHYIEDFKQLPFVVELLVKRYQINLEDTSIWLSQTEWATDNHVPVPMIEQVQQTLLELKLIRAKKPYEEIVHVWI